MNKELNLNVTADFESHQNEVLAAIIAENQERQTAALLFDKFCLDTETVRGMIFDCAYINDDGFETSEDGEPIENKHFSHAEGMPEHRPWPLYVGIHKDTREKISGEAYDALSEDERERYTKVRFFDIVDDNGQPVWRVYSDNTGFMHELISREIKIGDPDIRRYLLEIGKDGGMLREYYVTICETISSLQPEFRAEITPMLLEHTGRGYIHTSGQYLVANMEMFIRTATAEDVMNYDPSTLDSYLDAIASVYATEPGKTFDDLFSDEEIANYRNVNGLKLKGMRKSVCEKGVVFWDEVASDDPTLTVEEQKNYLRHHVIPDLVQKIRRINDRMAQIKDIGASSAFLRFVALNGICRETNQHQDVIFDPTVYEETPASHDYFRNLRKALEAQEAKMENDEN